MLMVELVSADERMSILNAFMPNGAAAVVTDRKATACQHKFYGQQEWGAENLTVFPIIVDCIAHACVPNCLLSMAPCNASACYEKVAGRRLGHCPGRQLAHTEGGGPAPIAVPDYRQSMSNTCDVSTIVNIDAGFRFYSGMSWRYPQPGDTFFWGDHVSLVRYLHDAPNY